MLKSFSWLEVIQLANSVCYIEQLMKMIHFKELLCLLVLGTFAHLARSAEIDHTTEKEELLFAHVVCTFWPHFVLQIKLVFTMFNISTDLSAR